MLTAIRPPAVAGRFYPGSAQRLRADVETLTTAPVGAADETTKIRAIGCISPHAGYTYSGPIAGALYRRLELPKRFVILCPNHTGQGAPVAITSAGAWKTPLGNAQIDEELAGAIMKASPLVVEDAEAHKYEHSLEVQLPFLQVLQPEFRFVPIAVGTTDFEWLTSLGEAIAYVISTVSEPVMIVASSDMNHYESDSVTRMKDHRAIGQILALNPRGLYDTVRQGHISMCGYAPATIMLTAALRRGATKAELVRYATSGDVSGDRDSVVGYAGLAIS